MKRVELKRRKPWRPTRQPMMRASWIKRSAKPMRQVNPEAAARRRAKRQAHYRSAEYRELRRDTFARDGNRCTFVALKVSGPQFAMGDSTHAGRCTNTTKLHCHEESYRGRKAVTLCNGHHLVVERFYYPHRQHR